MHYSIYDRLDRDLNQTKLSLNGIESNKLKCAKPELKIGFSEMVLCPFCLNWSEFAKFPKKKGFYSCPSCKNQMIFNTLFKIRKMGISEFAKWVFDYRLTGFFKKIPDFYKWNQNLIELGLSDDFWKQYHKLRDGYNYVCNKEEM